MKHLALLLVLCAALVARADESRRLYLSGTDKDHTVKWEFFCTAGQNSGKWSTIPVPSNWEFQGFGNYWYGTDRPKKGETIESGQYRHRFTVPADFAAGKRLFLVFEGSMTDTDAKLNGQSVGAKHQGSFYRFKYDVTKLLKSGAENLLEVNVDKHSADDSVNRAERQSDYWLAGGIYRPVYLEAVPNEYLERIATDARADGSLAVHAFPGNIEKADTIEAELFTLKGEKVGQTLSGPANAAGSVLKGKFDNVATWTSETPNLYELRVTLKSGQNAIHTLKTRIGFRTMEVRPGKGIYINGTRVLLKGICRHSFRPDTGRALSLADNEDDVKLIKEMHCNAVRMSHYPPDQKFLDSCDELGLYVLDELAGWQKAYSLEMGRKLIAEMVPRDVNHPSIVFWDNGNEGGWTSANDVEFGKWDPQNRNVLHPWALNGDVNTKHYPTYNALLKLAQGPDIFMPTEYLHGLFDGGAGAGLHDYWEVIRKSPFAGGAFFWVFADEGAKRTDKNGFIDVDGNRAPDGVFGPYHEKEGSFFTIKKLWSPIVIRNAGERFNGQIQIENRYHFTNVKDCSMTVEYSAFSAPEKPEKKSLATHKVPLLTTEPGQTSLMLVPMPPPQADAAAITVNDPLGRELYTWVFPLRPAGYVRDQIVKPAEGKVIAKDDADTLSLSAASTTVKFSKSTGQLASLSAGDKALPLTNGPRPTTRPGKLTALTHRDDPAGHIVEAAFDGDFDLKTKWTLLPSGWLRLDYSYAAQGKFDYLGITFDFPEAQMKSQTWLGHGPYRVWQNRLDGPTLGLWTTDYNQTLTGHSLWKYPEFRGYFADVRWLKLASPIGSLVVVIDDPSLYWRIGTDVTPASLWMKAVEPFPPGDVSILHAIPAIGNKFHAAKDVGPLSQPFEARGRYSATVYLKPLPN